MADVHTKKIRSYNMSRIRSKNTMPELTVRQYLFSQVFRYRIHSKELPGKPDIVLKKYSTVLFIHGCFWHAHKNCKYSTMPSSNQKYWKPKQFKNKEKDALAVSDLKKLKWHVITIWECQLKGNKKDKTLLRLYNKIMKLS